MRRLTYASRALHDFETDELVQLLTRARSTNQRLGVTGMLVYAAGSFLQLFEGGDAEVEVVWDRIRMDSRHGDLRVLGDVPVDHRLFSDWAMGFAHPDRASLEETLPGYRASLDYPFVSAVVIDAAETAETLLSLYARRSA